MITGSNNQQSKTKKGLEKLINNGWNTFDNSSEIPSKASGELIDVLSNTQEKKPLRFNQRQEFTIFSHQNHTELELIPRQIESLKEEIRKEIKLIKQTNHQFVSEVEEIEKSTLELLPNKAGIYHIRFLETLLYFLTCLKAKVREAKTWLKAMQTKKKKRGSLFTVLTKKKGTQYSLSQELQSARSVQ